MTYRGLINMIALSKSKGVYQKDIAKQTKITEQKLSEIIKGKKEPTKRELENFAIYFNCGLDDLIEIEK